MKETREPGERGRSDGTTGGADPAAALATGTPLCTSDQLGSAIRF
ncbi:hypothetical protein [Streptomyces sp. NPDC096012]